MLAAGTGAQATLLALLTAPAVLAPALRDELGLTLPQLGIVLAAPWVGPIATLLPWGVYADRAGERRALAAGLALAAAFTAPLASTPRYWAFVVLLGLAGAAGASVNSASGRAVMSWFGPEERGVALGIRQSSTPLGGVVAALALPALERAGGLAAAFVFLAALLLAGALAGALVVRDVADESGAAQAPAVLRDTRLWLLGGSGGFYLVAQVAVSGFVVLFLVDRRGFSLAAAAGFLAVIQATAIPLRIAVGRWSDVVGGRIAPLRILGLLSTATLGATVALLDAPTAVVLGAFLVAGAIGMSWNGLSFAGAAELVGRARSGAAIGFQQTVLTATASAVPPAFAWLVHAGSWRLAFATAALCPLAGWALLGRLRD